MSYVDILGLRIGMTATDAEIILAGFHKVTERSELGGREGRTKRIYINFDDGRALYLNFDIAERGGRLAELKLTFQGQSFRPSVSVELEEKYGSPTQTIIRRNSMLRILIWGGKTFGQDSVDPIAGVKTTMRVDESARSTTITLTGHN